MKITIDTDALVKNGMSIGEFLTMAISYFNVNLKESRNSLIEKEFAFADNTDDTKVILNRNSKNLFFYKLLASEEKIHNRVDRFINLAKLLKEIYPKGKKPGTNYMWRDSDAVIAKKLMTLVVKYNFEFTDAQAVEATKRYVQSFNGNYTYMQLLKYFILKTTTDADGNTIIKSEFMSLIENEGQENENNVNWTDELV